MIKLKISFRFIVTVVSILFAILLGLTRTSDPEFVQVLRLNYFDQLQIKYPRATEGQTYSVIVDIDEKSLREIGQWPWPRTVLADLFNKSRDAGMLVLGLDVLFAEKDRTSPDLIANDIQKRNPEIADLLKTLPTNESLAMEAMKKFPTVIGHSGLDVQGDAGRDDIRDSSVKVFLGKSQKPNDWLIQYPGLLANVSEFEKAAAGAGTVSVAEEPDGIIRRVPLISNVAGTIRPTLGLDMIRVFFERSINGKNPFKPSREHLHHYLIKKHSLFITLFIYLGFAFIPALSNFIYQDLFYTTYNLFVCIILYIVLLKYSRFRN